MNDRIRVILNELTEGIKSLDSVKELALIMQRIEADDALNQELEELLKLQRAYVEAKHRHQEEKELKKAYEEAKDHFYGNPHFENFIEYIGYINQLLDQIMKIISDEINQDILA